MASNSSLATPPFPLLSTHLAHKTCREQLVPFEGPRVCSPRPTLLIHLPVRVYSPDKILCVKEREMYTVEPTTEWQFWTAAISLFPIVTTRRS